MIRKYEKKCGCVRVTDDAGVYTASRCDTHKHSTPSGQTTPSQQAKAAGLKSLEQMSQMVGKPTETLRNWHRYSPELFRILLIGCVLEKDRHEQG